MSLYTIHAFEVQPNLLGQQPLTSAALSLVEAGAHVRLGAERGDDAMGVGVVDGGGGLAARREGVARACSARGRPRSSRGVPPCWPGPELRPCLEGAQISLLKCVLLLLRM